MEGGQGTVRGTFICEHCAKEISGSRLVWRCHDCGGPLAWRGPGMLRPADIVASRAGMWRYEAVLPVGYDVACSLGEPPAPLIPLAVEGRTAYYKLDYLMPTGSFKDRGAAVLISGLAALGVRSIIEESSGNAAAAMAGYSARAGIACTIYAPASASAGKLVQVRAMGARLVQVPGPRSATTEAAERAVAAGEGFFASHNWHPWFIEGVKTWALETWEQLGRLPDAVVVPVGSGSMLLGAARAFAELLAGGVPGVLPRLFAAQPAACAPIHAAQVRHDDDIIPVVAQPTLAEGTSITAPVRGREILRAIRASGGGTVAVDEAEIRAELTRLWQTGCYVEPTGAVAAAGFRQLCLAGVLQPADLTVVLLSGSGLKATERIAGLLDAAMPH